MDEASHSSKLSVTILKMLWMTTSYMYGPKIDFQTIAKRNHEAKVVRYLARYCMQTTWLICPHFNCIASTNRVVILGVVGVVDSRVVGHPRGSRFTLCMVFILSELIFTFICFKQS